MKPGQVAIRDQRRAEDREANREICRRRGEHWYSRINENVCLCCGEDKTQPAPWWAAA